MIAITVQLFVYPVLRTECIRLFSICAASKIGLLQASDGRSELLLQQRHHLFPGKFQAALLPRGHPVVVAGLGRGECYASQPELRTQRVRDPGRQHLCVAVVFVVCVVSCGVV